MIWFICVLVVCFSFIEFDWNSIKLCKPRLVFPCPSNFSSFAAVFLRYLFLCEIIIISYLFIYIFSWQLLIIINDCSASSSSSSSSESETIATNSFFFGSTNCFLFFVFLNKKIFQWVFLPWKTVEKNQQNMIVCDYEMFVAKYCIENQ